MSKITVRLAQEPVLCRFLDFQLLEIREQKHDINVTDHLLLVYAVSFSKNVPFRVDSTFFLYIEYFRLLHIYSTGQADLFID